MPHSAKPWGWGAAASRALRRSPTAWRLLALAGCEAGPVWLSALSSIGGGRALKPQTLM